MHSMAPYPWQHAQWQRLISRHQQKSLPHSLLLIGSAGMGKFDFAQSFAHYLLCLQPVQERHCGHCRTCQLILADTHPDLLIIQPEENENTIKIEQIRNLVDVFSKSAQQGNYRIAIIKPADKMNIASANALLKTLEEPGVNSLIMLVSASSHLLPATIRSRCQQLIFNPPPAKDATLWLAERLSSAEQSNLALTLAKGAPLRAFTIANSEALEQRRQLLSHLIIANQNPVQLAVTWQKVNIDEILDWLYSWVIDMIRLKKGITTQFLANTDLPEIVRKISVTFSLTRLFNYLDILLMTRFQLNNKLNLNRQLLLETLFCQWFELYQDRG